jgi:hypothetical protein
VALGDVAILVWLVIMAVPHHLGLIVQPLVVMVTRVTAGLEVVTAEQLLVEI